MFSQMFDCILQGASASKKLFSVSVSGTKTMTQIATVSDGPNLSHPELK